MFVKTYLIVITTKVVSLVAGLYVRVVAAVAVIRKPNKSQKSPDLVYTDEVQAMIRCCQHPKVDVAMVLAYTKG